MPPAAACAARWHAVPRPTPKHPRSSKMRLPHPLTAALAVCLVTASCASSAPPVSALPRPLPAEYRARCPAPPPAPAGPEVDPVAASLKDMYDLYGICAGRMVDLLDWMDGGQS